MTKKDEIIVYTNKTCEYCKQVKTELSNNNIKYSERLTDSFKEEWNQVSNLTGIPQVPTVVYKNNYFVPGRDFGNAQHIVGLINNFEQSNFSIEQITFERIKSLNHNINMAFGRLDQLLRQIENKLNE